jgi:hypothetical protein
MTLYSNETYGERVAGAYDEFYPNLDPHSISLLKELAGQGKALELAIGTGRVALPLSASNVEVHGIDIAPAMIEKLKSKPGGDRINVVKGDFADVSVSDHYSLIYIVFNSFFLLLSQEEQVRCFRNVAAHLSENGSFVIEAFVPNLKRFTGNQVNWVSDITTDQVVLDAGQHNSATQRVNSQRVVLTEGNVQLYPVQIRYAWPSELDLMAQLAGMRLHERYADWQRQPFTSDSDKHVSIYRQIH